MAPNDLQLDLKPSRDFNFMLGIMTYSPEADHLPGLETREVLVLSEGPLSRGDMAQNSFSLTTASFLKVSEV